MITWQQALETPAVQTHPAYNRYRVLCADDFPELITRDGYRAIVIALASGQPPAIPAGHVSVNYDAAVKPFRSCCG
jgi:hypothetical protein